MKWKTLFLKLALLVMAAGVLAIFIFALPDAIRFGIQNPQASGYAYIVISILLYLTGAVFLFILYQAYRLVRLIDHQDAFSQPAADGLRRIKRGAFAITISYVLGIAFFYPVADATNAPGIMLMGLTALGASFVIGVFAAVLQTLLQSAIDIKQENDLTV